MNKLNAHKVAVITGASSGIGRALSFQLALNYKVQYLCGRNIEALEQLKDELRNDGVDARIILLDLAQNSSIEKAAQTINETSEKVDLLVNNAGLSQRSFAFETSTEVEKQLFQINYFGPVLLSKLILQKLRISGASKILVTSSIVGKFGFPLRSTYSAAKHALHGFFESLAFEEKKHGVGVYLMIVGRVKTNISKNALTKNGGKYDKMDKGQGLGMSAEDCAKKMIRAMNRKNIENLIGGKEIIMVYFKKYLPFLFNKLAEKEVNHV